MSGPEGEASAGTGTGRVEAFSDAVFAIAITLLVLELHAPSGADVRAHGSLWRALAHEWPSYLTYLATFTSIAVIWLNHHAMYTRIARIDRTLQWTNLALLLGVSLAPFPTALAGQFLRHSLSDEPARTATTLYALLFTACAVPWVVSWNHLARHPDLLEPGWRQGRAVVERRRFAIGLAASCVSSLVCLAVPAVGIALFILVATYYAFTADRRR